MQQRLSIVMFTFNGAAHLQAQPDFAARGRSFDGDCDEQFRHKRTHFEQRVALGRLARIKRLLPIAREATAGNYRRYGTGGRSIVRDFLRRG